MKSLRPNNSMLTRLLIVMFVLAFVCFPILGARLFVLQIKDYKIYQAKALEQQTRDLVVTPKRGTIYDRNLKPLAISATAETLVLSPNDISSDKAREISKNLAEIIGMDEEAIYKITQRKTFFAYVKKRLEKDVADKVREYIKQTGNKGIFLIEDSKRYYPYGNFASHVIGFCGEDNYGLEGIEAYYDKYLKGVAGRMVTAKNAQNTDMPFKYEKVYDATDGYSVVLTIDEVVQHFMEKHLETAYIDNIITGYAAGIAMDVKTGEILAMAVKPDYDLNKPFTITDPKIVEKLATLQGEERTKLLNEARSNMWRNKAVTDTYYPGSVFKILTSAIALQEKLVTDTEHFHCPGYRMIGKRKVGCWKTTGHGTENFLQGIQNSCNAVFMDIGARIGTERFYNYVTAFGLREKTGIDIAAEAQGIFHPLSRFNFEDLSVSAFGQSFTVTPIELITAASAIANGGKLMQPYVMKKIVDKDGNIIESRSPTVVRQVVSEEVSKKLSGMLETVVTVGTGKNAYVKGYRVAGKTGTSEKVNMRNESGQVNEFIASFLAFAPADDPQVAVLVLLDQPHGNSHFGGVIAGPVVGRVMADILPYLDVEPKYSDEELANMDYTVPSVAGLTLSDAEKLLRGNKIKYTIMGNGDTVNIQIPKSGARVAKNTTVVLYTGDAKPKQNITVPEILGMTPTKAESTLKESGLVFRVDGASANDPTGTVVAKQSPAAGTVVESGTVIVVEFRDLNQTVQ